MCDWVTMLYRRKSTEHCKSAIMENKNYILKKKARIQPFMCGEVSGLGFPGRQCVPGETGPQSFVVSISPPLPNPQLGNWGGSWVFRIAMSLH